MTGEVNEEKEATVIAGIADVIADDNVDEGASTMDGEDVTHAGIKEASVVDVGPKGDSISPASCGEANNLVAPDAG